MFGAVTTRTSSVPVFALSKGFGVLLWVRNPKGVNLRNCLVFMTKAQIYLMFHGTVKRASWYYCSAGKTLDTECQLIHITTWRVTVQVYITSQKCHLFIRLMTLLEAWVLERAHLTWLNMKSFIWLGQQSRVSVILLFHKPMCFVYSMLAHGCLTGRQDVGAACRFSMESPCFHRLHERTKQKR